LFNQSAHVERNERFSPRYSKKWRTIRNVKKLPSLLKLFPEIKSDDYLTGRSRPSQLSSFQHLPPSSVKSVESTMRYTRVKCFNFMEVAEFTYLRLSKPHFSKKNARNMPTSA
jgi:hypothetical protein